MGSASMAFADNALFTSAEAAVLTQLSLKAVNNAIDKEVVSATPAAARNAGRRLNVGALLALALERQLVDFFVLERRRQLFRELMARPYIKDFSEGLVKVDFRQSRRDLAVAIRRLRRARSMVVVDARIQGGDPVFRGTRVPVHVIAAQLSQGETEEEICVGYPRLTLAMIRAAPLYAAAYPLRGPPRRGMTDGLVPVSVIRTPLSEP